MTTAITTPEVAITTSEAAIITSEVAIITSEAAIITSEVAITTSEVAIYFIREKKEQKMPKKGFLKPKSLSIFIKSLLKKYKSLSI